MNQNAEPNHNSLRYASEKASRFTESVIKEMSRIASAHNAINLAQSFLIAEAQRTLRVKPR